MSILGVITMILSGIAGVYLAAKVDKMKWGDKFPRLNRFTSLAAVPAALILGIVGGQMLGINTGFWLMYHGQYLISPGGV